MISLMVIKELFESQVMIQAQAPNAGEELDSFLSRFLLGPPTEIEGFLNAKSWIY